MNLEMILIPPRAAASLDEFRDDFDSIKSSLLR
jgi:hypothetical protein